MRSPITPEVTRQTIVVAPTTTVILGPIYIWLYDLLSGELINDNGSQTLNAQYEISFDGNAPWTVLPTDQLKEIAAGASREFTLPVTAYVYLRITGTMSGAGGNARRSAVLIAEDP